MKLAHVVARLAGCTNLRWYRQLCGGVWEQWWIDSPFNSLIWIELEVPTEGGERPWLARGRPTVEDYRRRSLLVPVRERSTPV